MLPFFAFSSLRRWSAAVLWLTLLLLAGRAARAQAPVLTGLSPTRNARSAAVAASPTFTFDQPMSSGAATLGAVKVFSSQRGGRLQNGARGTTTASGSTLTFDPTTDFKPGETIFSTVTTAAQSNAGAALAAGRVQQFTTTVGGTGRGNFLPGTDPAVGSLPRRVALADVDGDGDLDLLAANADAPGTVSVRLNGGDATGSNTGTFSNGSEVSVGSFPVGVALADVDGDGDLDFVTANRNASGSVSVRLNGGDATGSNTGSFSSGSTVFMGSQTNSVALADIDGDGDLDLLTTNQVTTGTVSVRLNGGDATGSNTGTFVNGNPVSVGSVPNDLAVGDVDGDGDLDLLTANSGSFLGGTVSVRLNGGTGTFSGTTDVAVGTNPFSVALGDVDGDGDLDFVTANSTSSGTASVRLNGGTGTFSGTTEVAVGTTPASVALADVDGDGDLDLLTPNSTNAGTVSVRLNLPPAPVITSFTPSSGPVGTVVTVTGTGLAGATAASVNGTAGTGLSANTATSLTFTVGGGSTTGVVVITTPGGTASSGSFAVVPLLTLTGLSPARNLRNAAVTASPAFTFDQPMSGGASSLLGVKVFSSQRGGRLQNGARGTATASGSVLTFDPTNDFKPGETVFSTVTKAAVGTSGAQLLTGQVQQFTTAVGGTGRGNFQPGTDPAVGNTPLSVALGDVDGDGDLDLLTANPGGTGTVSVRRNGGDATGTNTGTFSNGTNLALGSNPNSVALGDVDGDGDLDLLTANISAATVSVRLNQPAAPLPVELVSFTATAQGSTVQLAWRTASEKNSLRFDIERSADGQAFGRIGEVAAQGTKTTPTAYAYPDPNPIPQPIAYYRLRQVDLDGTFAYSPVRAVKLTSSPPHHLTLHPNPARTAVAVGGAEAGALVTVTDAPHRTVASAPADASGTARLALPVGLAAGVYVVRCGGQAQRLAVE